MIIGMIMVVGGGGDGWRRRGLRAQQASTRCPRVIRLSAQTTYRSYDAKLTI